MDVNGSPEFALTWKDWDMPAGEPICALRASERRTGDKGCFGWHTPTVRDLRNSGGDGKNPRDLVRQVALTHWPTPDTNECGGPQEPAKRRAGGHSPRVQDVALLAAWPTPNTMEGGQTSRGGKRKGEALMGGLVGWPTPQAHDSQEQGKGREMTATGRIRTHNGSDVSANLPMVAGWATPRAEDAESAGMRHSRGVADTLTAQAGQGLPLAGWGTPRVTTNGGNGNPSRGADGKALLEDQVHGIASTSCPAGTGKRGVLRPGHSRWLMGYPAAWDSCGATAMQSCRKSRRSS
jgi:hypothetical protein